LLKGFSDITIELTEAEKKLIPLFVKGFNAHMGPKNPITNREIVTRMAAINLQLTDVKVRKIINYIRNKDLVPGLVAASGGYFITHSPEELKKYISSLLGRENEIRRIREAMQEHLKKILYRKQAAINYTNLNQ
jgi:hypothetical protein